jgi:ribose-phosphate pyrophosphokinase
VDSASVVVTADLSGPNPKALDLIFLARTAREIGAREVVLLAPYLPYMRQDARFRPGEAVTSVCFAHVIGDAFDAVVTVDPHLHRHETLSDLYRIPARAVSAAPRLAAWVRGNAPGALLVGPDSEASRWVTAVAEESGSDHTLMTKTRRGDYAVSTALPDGVAFAGRHVVLVDDIASTGRTLIDAVRRLRAAGAVRVDALVIHPIFAGDALEDLKGSGVGRIASTNTIPHETNDVDVAPLLAEAVRALLEEVAVP